MRFRDWCTYLPARLPAALQQHHLTTAGLHGPDCAKQATPSCPAATQESLIVVTPLGEELRSLRTSLLSQRAVERFLGYMRSHHERMLGQSRRHVPNRPELIAKHGWDVKYAVMHCGFAYQGHEIEARSPCRCVTSSASACSRQARRGARDQVSAEISHFEHRIRELLDKERSLRPEVADLDTISAWILTTATDVSADGT